MQTVNYLKQPRTNSLDFLKSDWKKYALSLFLLVAAPLTFLLAQQQQNTRSDASNPYVMPMRSHPFFLVNDSVNIADLRAKAQSQEPWKTMYAKALEKDCKAGVYLGADAYTDNKAGLKDRGYAIEKVVGACTLVYMISTNPDEKGNAKLLIEQTLKDWPDLQQGLEYSLSLPKNDPNRVNPHVAVVPQANAFVASVLALDTLYNDIDSTERTKYETYLGNMASYFATHEFDTAHFAARAVWGMYRNKPNLYQENAQGYFDRLMVSMTADGVFSAGPGYAVGRYGGERLSKWGYMHIEELVPDTYFHGRFYEGPSQDVRIKRFFEWMFSAAYAPSGMSTVFADSAVNNHLMRGPNVTVFNVGRFSDEAAGYASWRISQYDRQTHFRNETSSNVLAFVTAEAQATPKAPTSEIWKDGEAVFWNGAGNTDDYFGALWNGMSEPTLTTPIHHRHTDSNALFLAAFGEELLVNSGYSGARVDAILPEDAAPESCTGDLDFCYPYLHDYAWSNNTLTANKENHKTRGGEGIVGALLAPGFIDFATGLSDITLDGTAVPGDSKHYRNFYFVSPNDGKNGYFVTIDEVKNAPQPASGDRSLEVAWHPLSGKMNVVQSDRQFQWEVQRNKTTPTYLSIFLVTAPKVGVPVRDGAFGGFSKKDALIGKYIRPEYTTRANGDKNIITVLYPHTTSDSPASIRRIGGGGYTGGLLGQGNGVQDYIVETISNNTQYTETLSQASFKGENIMYRSVQDSLAMYMVQDGYSFNSGAQLSSIRQGFESDTPITVVMRGMEGRIRIQQPAQVTFYAPGVTGVKINGKQVDPVSAGSGWVRVAIPTGNASVTLTTGGGTQPPVLPTDTPTPTNTPTSTPTNTPTNTPTKAPTNTPTTSPLNKVINGTVFIDRNLNNVKESTDPAVYTQVKITGPSGTKTMNTSQGRYAYTATKAGSYTVSVTLPFGYTTARSTTTVTIGSTTISPTVINFPLRATNNRR